MNLRPTGDKILVQPFPPPEKSAGGIMFADQYQLPSGVGRAVAVGPGKVNRKGILVPTGVQPGDVVQYRWIDGREVEWEGVTYKILSAEEVIGVEEKPEHSTLNTQHSTSNGEGK